MMNVEIWPLDIQARSHYALAHNWANVCAAPIRSNTVSANSGEQSGNFDHVGSCLRRSCGCEAKTLGTIDSGVSLNSKNMFCGFSSMRIVVSISATQSIFFVCIQDRANCATGS